MSHPPPIVSLQQLHDVTAWLLNTGHKPGLPVLFDRRGLEFLQPHKHDRVGLGLPPLDEMVAKDAVYLRAVF